MKLWPARRSPSLVAEAERKHPAAAQSPRPTLPEPPVRMYSLLLPPGFTRRR